ncbi:hypothetical protein [Falsirhodobacter halotolerans]|uniref:hypothetical protein n=1 Tax=Falsirhodobacter halotolerans TaxID=1146892 RepID=UPI001FD43A5D|nr:hypothetical protein [Falsirhodobacter halotolerans]MCJ8140556.1 hypothetical protein [Falsirhodobacter halotolerans]
MTQIARLQALSQMILDARIADVTRAARAREDSLAHLRALQVAPGPNDDPVLSAQVALRYQAWADGQRAAINATLAQQTADWLEAQDQARAAFGRAQVLGKLAGR